MQTSFSDQIRQKAIDIGFDNAGIVAVERLASEHEHLDTWLAKGFHGEMAWMARESENRSDPRLIFPEARSMIVCVLNYFTDHKHSGTGKISRYAWGDDYHDVVREKLGELLEWIKAERPKANGKICVDTAPIMDKAWAARAGLAGSASTAT